MRTRPSKTFCKTLACPSEHELLTYRSDKLSAERALEVSSHLEHCEFCCAELQLLESHPQADLCCCDETAVLPASLRRLAESLMGSGEPTLRAMWEGPAEIEPVGSSKS